ncbi:pentatricopeptide repeat-containing protein At5g16860-like [Primulina tabacum]|uniref:pentatricopeptide repeat-containing protein At5g16860-like n=1 Tax=Primulina tabacum TaxID=48773 RepID=UPI003F5A612C
MLFSSSFPPKPKRYSAAALRCLIDCLRFSSSTQQLRDPVTESKLIHQQHLIRGLPLRSNPDVTFRILSNYLSHNAHSDVLTVLRYISPSRPEVFFWNSLIKSKVYLGDHRNALSMFGEMRVLDWVPDRYTFPYILKACGELSLLATGSAVHALAFVTGHVCSNVFVSNAAVAMFGRCGASDEAQLLFDEMLDRGVCDVISWNSIMGVYVQIGECTSALLMLGDMVKDGDFNADAVSLVTVLPACVSVKAWRSGTEIHGYSIRRGLFEDVYVGNAIVDMYAKCGLMDQAKNVFDRMEVKDVVSWNALVTGYSQIGRFGHALELFERMRVKEIELNVVTWSAVISGYAQRGLGYEALDVFREMMFSGSQPNEVTLVSILSGCATVGALVQGKEIQCYVFKNILKYEGQNHGDMMVINSIIDLHAKCKNFRAARKLFSLIDCENRNVVTWTVMIGGCAQHGDANDALQLFSEMLKDKCGIVPNTFTISCALVACARLGALKFGQEIHAYVLRNCCKEDMLFVLNCLIDMYAKSGNVDAARAVFDGIIDKNVVSWTSIMTGYGMHGRGEEALQVFSGMRKAGLLVDGVTFVVVLYACSHSGMVEKGINYFNKMEEEFQVVPEVEHYACAVDLLGRAGRLHEGLKLIEEMPMEPNPIVWVALLSGCRVHGNVELAEHAINKLLELNFENDGLYTLLSNIYASARQWKDVARIRLLMKRGGIKKRPGCSWVQGKKGTAIFLVGDKSHPMTKEIYNLLDDLIFRIKILGYVPDTSFALHDVDDEEKRDLLLEHSEKLALAYGILTTGPGVPIRITKNLRVCGDCHKAFSYISRIIEHEIILRDPSRFHHFKNGSCSCKEYW